MQSTVPPPNVAWVKPAIPPLNNAWPRAVIGGRWAGAHREGTRRSLSCSSADLWDFLYPRELSVEFRTKVGAQPSRAGPLDDQLRDATQLDTRGAREFLKNLFSLRRRQLSESHHDSDGMVHHGAGAQRFVSVVAPQIPHTRSSTRSSKNPEWFVSTRRGDAALALRSCGVAVQRSARLNIFAPNSPEHHLVAASGRTELSHRRPGACGVPGPALSRAPPACRTRHGADAAAAVPRHSGRRPSLRFLGPRRPVRP